MQIKKHKIQSKGIDKTENLKLRIVYKKNRTFWLS